MLVLVVLLVVLILLTLSTHRLLPKDVFFPTLLILYDPVCRTEVTGDTKEPWCP